MGISIEVSRQRIGCFSHGVGLNGMYGCISGLVRIMPHVACAIAMLLLIVGEQPNPGPVSKLDEIFHQLIDLLEELRDSRDTLSHKIDDSVSDLTTNLHNCEDIIAAQAIRIDIVEQMQVVMVAQLVALQAYTVNTAACLSLHLLQLPKAYFYE